mmetsp:Transcript_20100/g.43995  ORF Transcript_20100/g.43995 Transcript_20100/m.43995 type:complete len:274 (+) Transcript_20100:85-906(+)
MHGTFHFRVFLVFPPPGLLGKPWSWRSLLRVLATSLLFCTRVMSSTLIARGLQAPPVPPVTTTGRRARQQCATTSAFAEDTSMASSTQSYPRSTLRMSAQLASVRKSSTSRTLHSGFMPRIRSLITTHLDRPTVSVSVCTCRLEFETQISSRSTRVSLPTPDRASASAAHDPTPPMPMTHTCASDRRASPSAPYIRSTPSKRARSSACCASSAILSKEAQLLCMSACASAALSLSDWESWSELLWSLLQTVRLTWRERCRRFHHPPSMTRRCS